MNYIIRQISWVVTAPDTHTSTGIYTLYKQRERKRERKKKKKVVAYPPALEG